MLKDELWASAGTLLFLHICCYYIVISSNNVMLVNAEPPSYANISHSWKNNRLLDGSNLFFSDSSVIRTLLFNDPPGDPEDPFGFGFYSTQPSNLYILAIYIPVWNDTKEINPVVVWSANGNKPVGEDATLELSSDGDLVLRDADGSFVWSTNTAGFSVSSVNLRKDGNLVLLNEKGETLWQSFDYPTDTLAPHQVLYIGQRLTSRVSASNFSSGSYFVSLESDGLHAFVVTNRSSKEFMYINYTTFYKELTNPSFVGEALTIFLKGGGKNNNLRLDSDGHLKWFAWGMYVRDFIEDDVYGDCVYPTTCGKYGICADKNKCVCPNAIDGNSNYILPIDPFNATLGCSLVTPLTCSNTHVLKELNNVTYFDVVPSLIGTDVESCKSECLKQCSCKAVFFRYYEDPSLGNCTLPSEVLTLRDVSQGNLGHKVIAYIKVQDRFSHESSFGELSHKSSHKRKIGILIVLAFLISFVLAIVGFYCYKIKIERGKSKEIDRHETLRQISFKSLRTATQNFCVELGNGAFGSVYKGTLADGSEVAVKRLKTSLSHQEQGKVGFIAEVKTIGRLHHFNLVRLIGYCDDRTNTLLVYEYVRNGSLDKWIFDEDRRKTLTWDKRQNIIIGMAWGLEYLHHHCNQNVIHFDIKPQNILLDNDFKAKIADFGLAKMLNRDQSQVRSVLGGTPGYMAPELSTGENITSKVDVYSFGVVVLEIVCGRRNLSSNEADRLIKLATEKADQLSDLIDKGANDMLRKKEEVVKIMEIAMSCLEHDVVQRPKMSMVVKALEDLIDVGSLCVDNAQEANYSSSYRPSESILSAPR